MNDFSPLVSIVIPVYNGSDYLSEAIDSALAQTYPNLEIVVVNDGSCDDGATERIALSYGDKIRYFSKVNGGVATALNTAIEKMTGEYFSWLSHDDLYAPDKVETQIRALSKMKDVDRVILYGDIAVFTDDPKQASELHLPEVPPENFRCFLTTNSSLHGCTLLIPKTAFDECGVFDVGLRTTQDYELWFRLAGRYRFVHQPMILVKARRHAEQGSIKMKDTALAECNALLIQFTKQLALAELVTEHPAASVAYAQIAASCILRGFNSAGRYAVGLSFKRLTEGSAKDVVRTIFVLVNAVLERLWHGMWRRVRTVWGI